MRCMTHCPKESGAGRLLRGAAVVAGLVVGAAALWVVAWLTANWLLVLGVTAAMSAVTAAVLKAVSVVSRRVARLALVSGPLAHRLCAPKAARPAVVHAEVQVRAMRARVRAVTPGRSAAVLPAVYQPRAVEAPRVITGEVLGVSATGPVRTVRRMAAGTGRGAA